MAKKGKTEPVYFLLLILTAAFLCATLLFALQNRELGAASYTITTQKRAEEEIAPERKLVNINTATAAELETLTGIGSSLAQRIVEDREANGPFTAPEELQRVSGIGTAKYAALEKEITVEMEGSG